MSSFRHVFLQAWCLPPSCRRAPSGAQHASDGRAQRRVTERTVYFAHALGWPQVAVQGCATHRRAAPHCSAMHHCDRTPRLSREYSRRCYPSNGTSHPRHATERNEASSRRRSALADALAWRGRSLRQLDVRVGDRRCLPGLRNEEAQCHPCRWIVRRPKRRLNRAGGEFTGRGRDHTGTQGARWTRR